MSSNLAKMSRLAIVFGSLVLSICLGEAGLRLISPDQYFISPPGMRAVFRPSPEIMPGVEGESQFSINEHGLRGDPFLPDQTYRILAVGGSATECLFLDNKKAWPYLLQEFLNAKAESGKRFWVGNAGRSGFNTRNHIVQVTQLTGQYPRVDALLILVGVNDVLYRLQADKHYRSFPGVEGLSSSEYQALMASSFSVLPSGSFQYPLYIPTELSSRLHAVKRRFFNSPNPALIQDDAGKIYIEWRKNRRSAAFLRTSLPDLSTALEEYARNINRIIDYANTKQMKVIFVTQPAMWRSDLTKEEENLLWMGGVGDYQTELGHEYYSSAALAEALNVYNTTLLTTCRNRNILCIDLANQLPMNTSVFYDDVHFNESGSGQVARIIGAELLRDFAVNNSLK